MGKVSLDDCDMLTSSLGCTVTPLRAQIDAITSLAFMFELVPEPVWNTSIGKCSSQAVGDLTGGGDDRVGLLRRQQAEVLY